jgi:hypothetical protein
LGIPGLEPYGHLRIGIGCAPGLGDAERFERPKEIGVFLGRHHADEATKAMLHSVRPTSLTRGAHGFGKAFGQIVGR